MFAATLINTTMNTEGITLEISNEQCEEIFHTALCNGLGYVESGYGLALKYKATDYANAKGQLALLKKNTCFEDVIMQMLKSGKVLKMQDIEGDGAQTEYISIERVHERVKNVPIDRLMNFINEEDDADDADIVIQTVLYGEIIFG